MNPSVHPFFHAATGSWSYVATDPATRHAVVIDPVLDFDAKSARTGTALADAILAHVHSGKLVVDWVLETHAHADHLSAGTYLAAELGAPLAIGAGITAVQAHAARLYGFESGFAADGSQFDRLWRDGDRVPLGSLEIEVIATPGHTAGHMSLFVELQKGPPVLLCGDAADLTENIEHEIAPGLCWREREDLALGSIRKLKTLGRETGASLWPNHDLAFWAGTMAASQWH